jgi:DNA/RNA-binding domain of Phe-tRNA-synthetase-like protein
MRIVAILARGIDNSQPKPQLSRDWQEVWIAATAARVYGNSQSHPRVRPWREAFRQIGFSGKDYPSSIEALLRRALKGGAPVSINPIVDLYNAVSLRHVVPAGGFDASFLDDDLVLRFTRGGDVFQALDEASPMSVPAGEVAYASGSLVLTRHFVWRQARAGLITDTTRDVLLVSEILNGLPDGVADAVEADLLRGLELFFCIRGEAQRLDDSKCEATWDCTASNR